MRYLYHVARIVLIVLLMALTGCGSSSSGNNDPFGAGGTPIGASSSYKINFITSKAPTDPDGTLNTLSGSVPAGYVGRVFFKQLVPFEVVGQDGKPVPHLDVMIEVSNTGRNQDTIVELVPPLPAIPGADVTKITVKTDDNGQGIFTCNVSLLAPGDGLSNTESIVYTATAVAPDTSNLQSYGGFIVTITQEKAADSGA